MEMLNFHGKFLCGFVKMQALMKSFKSMKIWLIISLKELVKFINMKNHLVMIVVSVYSILMINDIIDFFRLLSDCTNDGFFLMT